MLDQSYLQRTTYPLTIHIFVSYGERFASHDDIFDCRGS